MNHAASRLRLDSECDVVLHHDVMNRIPPAEVTSGVVANTRQSNKDLYGLVYDKQCQLPGRLALFTR